MRVRTKMPSLPLLPFLLVSLTVGCIEIDMEPGFAAEFESADIRVTRQADGDVVAVDVGVMVRVGTYALSGRDFQITRADIFSADRVVASVNLGAPAGGEMMLLPGESHSLVLSGETRPDAFPEATDALCSGMPVASMLIQYQATTFEDGPLGASRDEMGLLELDGPTIECTLAP